VIALVAAVAVARDLRLVRVVLPAPTRQVPETVFSRGAARSSFQFGFELGTGVRTQIPASAPYVVAAALVFANPGLATTLLVGVAFGIGRSIMPLMRAFAAGTQAWDALLRGRYRILIEVAVVLAVLAIAVVAVP
jgi:hypothetical protein